jgi:O-antigen ligase
MLDWKLLFLFLFALIIAGLTVQQNASWRQFYADYKIASAVDQYQTWRGAEPLPLNENGQVVSGTNYDRISWAVVGSRLLLENPLGYGVVENSFGHLARQHWPEAEHSQTHSGLLDLTLGIGFPGVMLICFAFVFAFRGALGSQPTIRRPLLWMVISIGLLFLTTEVSQRIYIEALFLLLGCSVGLALSYEVDQSVAKLE